MKAVYRGYILSAVSFLVLLLAYQNCAESKKTEDAVTVSSSEEEVLLTDVVSEFSGKFAGNLNSVGSDGKAWGYVLDTAQKAKALKVIFYGNGPVGAGGTYIGEATANLKGVGANEGHYFSFKVPPEMANGTFQFLYAYAHEAKAQNLIKPSPVSYVAYTPKAEVYFNQSIAPFIANSCTRCHTWTHASMFYGPLMTPAPHNGGTATANRFIEKMAGIGGHAGGTFCNGGVNSEICVSIQNWWRAEFQ